MLQTTEPMHPGACAPQLERENSHAITREKPVQCNKEPALQGKIQRTSMKTLRAAPKTPCSPEKRKEKKRNQFLAL